jgi:uncharacterized hydrophobic protein (TIGR00271 family)
MIHVRLIAPAELAEQAITLLRRSKSVAGVIVHPGAGVDPPGDVVAFDVAEEDASVIVAELRRLGIAEAGVLDLDRVDASISARAREAERHAAGSPADAVVWENVAARTREEGRLGWGLLALFVLSGVIAAVAILLDSAPMIVGAMAVSPDFGPIATFAVGAVRLRWDIARAGLLATWAGFSVAIAAAFLAVAGLRLTGVAEDEFVREGNALATSIAAPDWYSLVVAICAGAAGMLSVTLGRSAALVGVAISITTIPAAADIGLALAYGDGESFWGSSLQLAVNLAGLLLATTLTLAFQRWIYARRVRRHRELSAAA